MSLTLFRNVALTAVSAVLILGILTVAPAPTHAAKGGKGGGDGSTPDRIPVDAYFERFNIETDIHLESEAPLIDADLKPDGGWSELTEIGNYTFQIGDRGKRGGPGDRTLTLRLDNPIDGGAEPSIDFNIVWMAFNREQCTDTLGSNAFGECAADDWANRLNDPAEYESDIRPGLRDMFCGEEINVSLTLRGEDVNGTDQFLSCNESTAHNEASSQPDIEFGTAVCVHQNGDGACDQWVIYSKDRNPAPTATEVGPDGPGVSCFAREDERKGAVFGVFDMDFRIHLCPSGQLCPVDIFTLPGVDLGSSNPVERCVTP